MGGLLVGVDLAVGDAGVVVDGRVDVVEPGGGAAAVVAAVIGPFSWGSDESGSVEEQNSNVTVVTLWIDCHIRLSSGVFTSNK